MLHQESYHLIQMTLATYQTAAIEYAKSPALQEEPKSVVLLGLAGEVGELLGEYKKRLRDGDDHEHFSFRVKEKLGDVLWYVAATAHYFAIDLDDVATANIQKISDRWGLDPSAPLVLPSANAFDADLPESEKFPRQMEFEIRQVILDGVPTTQLLLAGEQKGSDITDRAVGADGYRFHDILHLAFAAVLGWSPVLRNLMNLRRISRPEANLNEDGGRATAIEEGISALVFAYAQDRKRLSTASMIDYDLLQVIRSMTRHLEVSRCSLREWQVALLQGFEAWRAVEQSNGGRLRLDLDTRTISIAAWGEA